MNQLNDIGVSVRHHIFSDDGENIYYVTAGRNDYTIWQKQNVIDPYDNNKNTEEIKDVLEEKNGVCYIPLRAIAKILDIEKHISWDNTTRTITISK